MDIAIDKNQALWIKKQTVKGTAVWPSATDAVLLEGGGNFKQDPVYNKDLQKRLTVGELGRKIFIFKPGEFSFSTPFKPSGSLGVAPVPAPIMESLMGHQTIVGSTSVSYTLLGMDENLVYLTVLVKDNFDTYMIKDAVVSKATFKFLADESDAALLVGDFSGIFLAGYHAGTDATSQLEAINATAIHVVDASKFEAGQKIIVGTSGVTAGHLIESVVVSTNIVTIAATGLESEQASGVTVKGWTPSITESGILIHGRFGKYQEKIGSGDFTDVLIADSELTIDNGLKVISNEKTDSGFPDTITKGDRIIEGFLNRYLRSDGGAYRYQVINQVARQIKLRASAGAWASNAGKRVEFQLPNVEFNMPETSGDVERNIKLKFTAFETVSLNDSLTILLN